MLKAERAAYVHQRLEELYPETPIPLDHSDPYTLLVAVLLSAQCTDERVNLITPALFKRNYRGLVIRRLQWLWLRLLGCLLSRLIRIFIVWRSVGS